MQVGVGFSTTVWPISRIICAVMGTTYSHTWIYVDRGDGDPTVIEAGFSGFTEVSYRTWRDRWVRNVEVRQVKVDLTEALEACQAWYGEAYDYAGLVGEGWVELGRWLKKKWKNPLHAAKSLYCAEAVMTMLKLAKYPGTEGAEPEDCDPRDCHALVEREHLWFVDTGGRR